MLATVMNQRMVGRRVIDRGRVINRDNDIIMVGIMVGLKVAMLTSRWATCQDLKRLVIMCDLDITRRIISLTCSTDNTSVRARPGSFETLVDLACPSSPVAVPMKLTKWDSRTKRPLVPRWDNITMVQDLVVNTGAFALMVSCGLQRVNA